MPFNCVNIMALAQHHRLITYMLLFCKGTSIQTRFSQTDLKSKISGVEELLEEFRKQLQQEQTYTREEEEVVDVCLADFNAVEEHIIRATASIEQGAIFLSAPDRVYSWKDCLHACCADPHCTVAVVQEDLRQSDDSLSCYLFSCTHRNKNVCSFAAQAGFSTYSRAHNTTGHLISSSGNEDVNKLVNLIRRPEENPRVDDDTQMPDMDEPPRSDPGQDVVIQLPTDCAVLDGRDSVDDHGVTRYEWALVKGDPAINMKVTQPGLLKISSLQEGSFTFQMTVTDTEGQKSSDNVTVTVLAPEHQAEVDGKRKSVTHPAGLPSPHRPVAQPEETEDHSMAQGGPRKTMEEARPTPPQAPQTPQSGDWSKAVPRVLPQPSHSEQESPVRQEPCAAPPAVGPCKGIFPRWFYDPVAEECKHFIYGGCKGNHNNFLQVADCVNECIKKTGPANKQTTLAPPPNTKHTETVLPSTFPAEAPKVTMKWPEIKPLPERDMFPKSKPHSVMGGHPGPESGAILPLALGLIITALLLLMIGCRLWLVRHKLKKARPLTTEESDYLINGMYL
ncbi:low-density lipoprotein receptor-related protein 11-like isoform X2 [Salvelinus fontinalis]|uniref:low-density lipoprotein receptor-related protein 11-like isoform X2 n=1 Tax=Salvelinus fontinalis TaxID=8038 RepID=UPI002485E488|nr:low-density lipoprotein receptor-related protein 11-like isoform X2 [Salvelinus fontinalis]